jgi:hypothetical protein
MLGAMVKLLPVVGVVFFFFSRHKVRFALACFVWAAVFFAAPMLISSPGYIVGTYGEWYQALVDKNASNITSWGDDIYTMMNNISALGMVRRISGSPYYSDLWVIAPAMLLMAVCFFRVGQWRHEAFRQTVLAALLMFVVLFSTGSENSSYVTAFVGIALWYTAAPWQRGGWDVALMVFAFVLASLGTTDVFPASIRKNIIHAYALKALPVTVIWLKLCYEMLREDYAAARQRQACLNT